jgi:hypothetical protein
LQPMLGPPLNMWCCYHSEFVNDLGENDGEMLDEKEE